MDKKEIILTKIADILAKPRFLYKRNWGFKASLKCCGLNDLYERYSEYLEPYCYRTAYGNKYENGNDEYNVFLGFDSIFSDLYEKNNMKQLFYY